MVVMRTLVVILLMMDLATCLNNTREKVLSEILNGYDATISPAMTQGGPVTSEVQLYISSISSISDSTMDYSMTIFLRQRWKDHRLAYNKIPGLRSLELDTKMINDIWVPDLYILNEKESKFHNVAVPNKLMHIYNDGKIFYSVRVSGTYSCEMNLLKYPMDYQICHFIMESYGQSTENLLLRWHKTAVERPDNLTLPQFHLEKIHSFVCDKDYGGINYTCIQMNIHLIRNFGYHMIQIYVPSILIVCLSWVSFWLNIDATPARISLGLLTVLTMTTQSSGARANLPKVSYIKAIDVWMSMCLFFVFAALIEFAWVNVLARVQQRRQTSYLTSANADNGSSYSPHPESSDEKPIDGNCLCFKKYASDREKARIVDKCARIVFPCVFVLFNMIYWIFYMFWKPVAHQ